METKLFTSVWKNKQQQHYCDFPLLILVITTATSEYCLCFISGELYLGTIQTWFAGALAIQQWKGKIEHWRKPAAGILNFPQHKTPIFNFHLVQIFLSE